MISLMFLLSSTLLVPTWLKSGPDLCRTWLPASEVAILYDALVCGSNLPAGHDKQVFIDTGLIHLMVVSGSHLAFIEILLGFLPRVVRLWILAFYCYLTGFQAPVVRAFLRRAIGNFLVRVSGVTSLQLEAATIALALTLYPQWLGSRSFLMSWMCGLALCSPPLSPRWRHFDQALKSYFFLLPFCFASPYSIAWNTLLAPFVGIILFPACIAAMIIPRLVPLTDGMWHAFMRVLDLGPQGMQLGLFLSAWSLSGIPILDSFALIDDGGEVAARIGVFLTVFLIGAEGGREFAPELIVWNVGQGQWATIIDDQACWHLDMGGEFAPFAEIARLCRRRPNRVSLSHWDMDHIGFLGKARGLLPQLCVLNAPVGPASVNKEATLNTVPRCEVGSPFSQWADPRGKTANAKSWVVDWRGVLAPGDSPRDEEKHWIHHVANLEQVGILILGHHGSRTSTSPLLLHALPKLRLAISSARFRRYHHPHAEVVRELNHAHIPLLRTEEWGTIHVPLTDAAR